MPNDPFYRTKAWRLLRAAVIRRDGGRCRECGAIVSTRASGKSSGGDVSAGRAYVDHIKNRGGYPHLAMDESNLKTLCAICHNRKGARGEGVLGRDRGPDMNPCDDSGDPSSPDHPWNR